MSAKGRDDKSNIQERNIDNLSRYELTTDTEMNIKSVHHDINFIGIEVINQSVKIAKES